MLEAALSPPSPRARRACIDACAPTRSTIRPSSFARSIACAHAREQGASAPARDVHVRTVTALRVRRRGARLRDPLEAHAPLGDAVRLARLQLLPLRDAHEAHAAEAVERQIALDPQPLRAHTRGSRRLSKGRPPALPAHIPLVRDMPVRKRAHAAAAGPLHCDTHARRPCETPIPKCAHPAAAGRGSALARAPARTAGAHSRTKLPHEAPVRSARASCRSRSSSVVVSSSSSACPAPSVVMSAIAAMTPRSADRGLPSRSPSESPLSSSRWRTTGSLPRCVRMKRSTRLRSGLQRHAGRAHLRGRLPFKKPRAACLCSARGALARESRGGGTAPPDEGKGPFAAPLPRSSARQGTVRALFEKG